MDMATVFSYGLYDDCIFKLFMIFQEELDGSNEATTPRDTAID